MSGSTQFIGDETPSCYEQSSGTSTYTYYPYPPCYEPKDPCKDCPFANTCTKRFKPIPQVPYNPWWPWYPYYVGDPVWYTDEGDYTWCTTFSISNKTK